MPDVSSTPERYQAVRYALIPIHGYDITAAVIGRMLDPDESGTSVLFLNSGQPVPLGAQPIIIAPTTVFAMVCVERLARAWHTGVPRPWLVLVADVPAAPAPPARYRLRALQGRLAGVANVPYLPPLRTVEGPDEAMKYQDVQKAAAKLRRHLGGNR